MAGRAGVFVWIERLREAFARIGARRRVAARLEDETAVEPLEGPRSFSESERLARFLASELRLPLAALARLGARCTSAAEPDLAAVGRALARESERLDVLVTNTLELGLVGDEPSSGDRVDLRDLLERVLAGHRALIEGLAIRVRVVDASRSPFVRADHGDLLLCLSALFSDLIERVPRRGEVALRLRELHGFARVDGAAPGAEAAARGDRTTILRARALVARDGGELWETAGREAGFGLTLPLHPRGTAAPVVALRSGRSAPVPA